MINIGEKIKLTIVTYLSTYSRIKKEILQAINIYISK